ncbi:MAG TPA: hypothetical protein DEG71_09365 [Clostridiales bacterium]|nr:hypothetical protein [Clostridiales bacterium]
MDHKDYKGYTIVIQHHENVFKSKSLTERILGRLYGPPTEKIFKQDNITIYKKTAIIYNHKRFGNGYIDTGKRQVRTIYFADIENKTGIEVYIKYAAGHKVSSDVEQMMKKVLCEEIYKTCGIKLTKQDNNN